MTNRMKQQIKTIDATLDTGTSGVFSSVRTLKAPPIDIPSDLTLNIRLQMEGRTLLRKLPDNTVPIVFFDPQYRGVYDKMKYGNEDTSRNNVRVALPQMDEETIIEFLREISRVLIPSGHLFLWMDKFHLCSDFRNWIEGTNLSVVDMLTWDKGRIGLGYRTRHRSEFCVILQQEPHRAKGVWTLRNIPDVWQEKILKKTHPHNKPIDLQGELIEAVSSSGDLVVDPCAGSFSVLDACRMRGRNFLGCDVSGQQYGQAN